MERCGVTLTIPYSNGTTLSTEKRGDRSQVHVWSLKQDSQRKLDVRRLSWRTKPQRDRHLGSFPLAEGSTQELPSFPCTSGSYVSFEVACATPDCYIDLTAMAKNVIGRLTPSTIYTTHEVAGVYLTQYQTI